jgi:hypothetical protein
MKMANFQNIQHETNYWCRTKGIKYKDYETHPQIDDVHLLMRWRDEMWNKLTKSEQSFWGAVWSYVYHKKMSLRSKHLQKLEELIIIANDRHLKNLVKMARQQQKIKQLRQAKT